MARNYLKRLSFSEIEKASTRELRSYYSNLRDIFQKQIKRLSVHSPDYAEKYQRGGPLYFGTIAERKKLPYLKGQSADVLRRDLERATKELSQLTIQRSKTGSILTNTGYNVPSIAFRRAKAKERDTAVVAALHDAGYEHISRSTLKNFGKFMDAMRSQYGKKLPNSELMAEFFDNLKYNTKRKATADLIALWEDYQNNGYEPDNGNEDLFST